MKTIVKRLIRDEKGAAMVLALVLLLIGGLIATPLLAHMGTGIIAGEVYEKRTAELYAADAGVEDAIWRIQSNNLTFDEDNPAHLGPLTVNGRSVQVEIYREDLDPTCGEELTYQILSTAATFDGGNTAAIVSATTVEAYLSVSYLDFSASLDYAIMSNSTIDIQPNNYIDGDVWLPDASDPYLDGEEAISGTIYDSSTVDLTWPDAEDLSRYYWAQVDDLEPSTDDQIDIPGGTSENDPFIIERLSSAPEGEQLTVKGDGWIKLGGTIYVKGDLVLSANPEINLNLNGQTIFAEGGIDIPPGVTLSGSGCIIAVGDIKFKPNMATAEDEFVLVMSIEGKTTLQPNGSFTGCVVGNEVVRLQPAHGEEFTIKWISPEGKGLDFPMGIGDDPNELPPVTGVSIESWEIKQQ